MSADVPVLDLPVDPDLAVVARALELYGFAGEVWDASWRIVYLSSEYRTLVSAGRRHADVGGLGEHLFSAGSIAARETWPTGPTFESFRESLRDWGSFVMSTTPGGREALLEIADPRLKEVLQSIRSACLRNAFQLLQDCRIFVRLCCRV